LGLKEFTKNRVEPRRKEDEVKTTGRRREDDVRTKEDEGKTDGR